MGGRGANTSVKIQSGFSELTGYIPEISKETEKAYLLNYQTLDYSASSIIGYQGGSIQYGPTYKNVWVPKSQVQVKGNKVIAMPDWLAKKSGLTTKSMNKIKQQKQNDYDNLVAKAKSLGIKGARKGLKAKTLKSMIEKAGG